jgi:hypothetical protein
MAVIENVIPILRVEDLDKSRHHYVEVLGFSLDWETEGMISVSRDRKSIMLCDGEQASRAPGFGSASMTLTSSLPNSRPRVPGYEARPRTSAGPASLRSQTRTATFSTLGPSPNQFECSYVTVFVVRRSSRLPP